MDAKVALKLLVLFWSSEKLTSALFLNNTAVTSCLFAYRVRMKEIIEWRNAINDEASIGLQRVFLCILRKSIIETFGFLNTRKKLMQFPLKPFVGMNEAVYRGIKKHLDQMRKIVTIEGAKEAFRFLRYFMPDESLPRVEYTRELIHWKPDDAQEYESLEYDEYIIGREYL